MPQQFSFSQQIWRRLKKNKGALFGLIVIIIACLVAVFAYIIAPDDTPNADMQAVEIQAKKAGYSQLFLKIPAEKNTETGWFSKFLHGRPAACRYLPITSYSIKNDSLIVHKFIDDDTTVTVSYTHLTLPTKRIV